MPTPDSLYDCLEMEKEEIAVSKQTSNFVRIYSIRLNRSWSDCEKMLELAESSKVAMKEICRGTDKLSPSDICKREFDRLRELSHSNIVTVFGVNLNPNPEDPAVMPSYLMEIGECSLNFIFCSKNHTDSSYLVPNLADGTAHDKENNTFYTMDHLFTWLKQVVDALAYLHEKKLLHRDVKGTNVLLFNQKRLCKLCDFDTCREIDPTGMTPKVGSDRWRAPELRKLSGSTETVQYNKPADCYSLGVLACEGIFREQPFTGYPDSVFSVCNQDIPDISELDPPTGAMRIIKGKGSAVPVVWLNKEKSVFTCLPEDFWPLLEELLLWTPENRRTIFEISSYLDGLTSSRRNDLAKIIVQKDQQRTDTGSLVNAIVISQPRSYSTKRMTYSLCLELNPDAQERVVTVFRDFSSNITVMYNVPNDRVDEIRHEFTFHRSNELTHDIKGVDQSLVDQVHGYCSTERKFTKWMKRNFESDKIATLRNLVFVVVNEPRLAV